MDGRGTGSAGTESDFEREGESARATKKIYSRSRASLAAWSDWVAVGRPFENEPVSNCSLVVCVSN